MCLKKNSSAKSGLKLFGIVFLSLRVVVVILLLTLFIDFTERVIGNLAKSLVCGRGGAKESIQNTFLLFVCLK